MLALMLSDRKLIDENLLFVNFDWILVKKMF